jgi:hypothetical protein
LVDKLALTTMPHKFEADLISLQESSMSLPTITESIIRAGTGAQSFERGQEYYRSGAISNTAIQGHILTGECEGTQEPYYQVRVELDEAGIRSARCTCAYDYGGFSRDELMALMTKLSIGSWRTTVVRPRTWAISPPTCGCRLSGRA